MSLLAIYADILFMVGGFAFAAMLLPTLLDREAQVPLSTSFPTGALLTLYAATFADMGMWLSTLGNGVTASAWYFIAAFRRV